MKIDKIWSTVVTDIERLEVHEMYQIWNLENNFKKHKVNFNTKEFNSLGFRCDEFKKNHEGKHILFTGCSTTAGVALEQEFSWAKIVFNNISKEEKCSGYFNLAISGTSIFDQIFNLFKYFKKYGNPDYIFFCVPDAVRFYSFFKNEIHNTKYDDSDSNLLLFLGNQYYLMLDFYCKSNNIKMYSFTWNAFHNKRSYNDILSNNFDSFYKINVEELNSFVFDYIQNNKNIKNLEKAQDNSHFGIAFHVYWANFIYNKYKELNNATK